VTKEQLTAENERLGKEAAALRVLLTVIAEGQPPMYAVPGNHRDGWLQVGSNRIHAVAAAAEDAMKKAGTDGFVSSLHAMAGYLRREFARPLGYEPETDEPERVVFTDEDEDRSIGCQHDEQWSCDGCWPARRALITEGRQA
jgi:hypothetical protein